MSLLSAQEFQDLLGISDPSLETKIKTMMPAFEGWITDYLQDFFHARNYMRSSGMVFDADAKTLTDSDGEFLDADTNFRADMSFHLLGTIRNDGVYSASTVTATVITLDDNYSFIDENFTPSPVVTIYEIIWPVKMKYAVAKAIEFDLGKTRAVVEAPSRQNAFDSDKAFRYPERILSGLGKRALV